MTVTLNKIPAYGRALDQYVEMFALSDDDLDRRILGCGDGPASFNATLSKRGGRIVSVDPIYRFSREELRIRTSHACKLLVEQTRKNADQFIWDSVASPEDRGRIRMAAMNDFLADYPEGLAQRRYIAGALPALAFGEHEFDLALCAHLLFLYSEQLSEEFHVQSIRELCRVASEIRIFPLIELTSEKSRHLQPVLKHLEHDGYTTSIETVPYEFQKNGNQMLRICARPQPRRIARKKLFQQINAA